MTPCASSRNPLSFKSSIAVKGSGKKALAVLWLRDLIDHVEGRIEIPLWHAKSGDYSRLKLNYVPPDGNLASWDSDKEKVVRIGSVWLDIAFRPGITDLHHKMLEGAGAKKRGALEEFDRQDTAGLRDDIGKMDERVPRDHQASESFGTQTSENRGGALESLHDDATSYGPLNTVGGDSHFSHHDIERTGANTLVPPENVEHDQLFDPEADGPSQHDDDGEHSTSDDSEGKSSSIVTKFKDWKKHEKELNRDHRGVMQVKPARTAVWIKDNVEEGAHKVKKRFSMRTRTPDVETEV